MRFFDAFVNDLNTVERGKRIDRAGIHRVFAQGMPLPGSMFALDIDGGTVEDTGLGFDDGDADRPCMPIPGTLVPVPWQPDVAQLQLRMFDHDGKRFFGDPRWVLENQLATFAALELTPVIAIEYEFYLVDAQRGPDGLPQPPKGPLTGRREFRTQINSMTDLNEYSPLLAEIDSACRQQNVPATSALAEYGPGQYEVNLSHAPDALRVCDEALRFKRVVKSVARAHGCDATFLPKPYRDMAGSGLHVHVSLLDKSGANIFAAADPLCQQAAAPGDRRHARDARRWHGAVRAGTEFLSALSHRGLRAGARRLVHQQSRLRDSRARLRRREPAHRTPAGRRRRQSLPGRGLGARRHPPRTHTRTRAAAGHHRQCLPAARRAAADSLERSHRTLRAQRNGAALLRRPSS